MEEPLPESLRKKLGLVLLPVALHAIHFPPETEDLYFVASGHGGHVFATTLDEHHRNVTQYRTAGPTRK